MEITTTEMTLTKNVSNKSDDKYIITACRLFREVIWNYLCKKLPWIQISKVSTQIESKILISWH